MKPKMKKPANCSAPVVQLAVDNPAITHEELAAQDFEADKRFGRFELKNLENHEENLRQIAIASRMALRTCSMSKAEVIEAIQKMDTERGTSEASNGILKFLCDARDTAEQLAELIQMAEIRHAVAMANVYAENGSVRESQS